MPRGYGRTRMRVVPSAAGADLLPFLRNAVEPGSHLRTDGHRDYDGAVEAGFRPTAISIAASGDPAKCICPQSTGSRACSSAGCWAPTRAR